MITTNFNGSHTAEPGTCFNPSMRAAECRLTDLVAQLIQHLGQLQQIPPTDEDSDRPDRWNDDEFTYLEAALPESAEGEIDINIHDGRVYIRLAI